MTGHQIALTHTVDAAPEAVWAVLTDVRGAPETLSGVTRVEVLTDGPYGVGTRWRETRRMFGKSETQEMWVSEAEEQRRTVVLASSGGIDYRTEFTLSPVAASTTDLTMRFSAEATDASRVQKALWRVLGPLGLKASRKVMARDLADIARRAEQLGDQPQS